MVRALISAVRAAGTICAQASWDDIPLEVGELPAVWRRAYHDECPGFDPDVSGAAHYEGRVAERIRTWQGARRSAHPADGVAAIGAAAAWLTGDHRLDDGFGTGSPNERLVDADGIVLSLGAPLDRLSLLHHAAVLAALPGLRRRTNELPMMRDGRRLVVRYRDLDFLHGAYLYERVIGPDTAFGLIARSALAAGAGHSGQIGQALCHVSSARALVSHAVGWLRAEFRPRAGSC